MEVKIDIPLPEGWETTGEYRRVEHKESFYDPKIPAISVCHIELTDEHFFIVRRVTKT